MVLPRPERDRILRFEGFFDALRPLPGSADEADRRAALEWCARVYHMKVLPDCRADLAGPVTLALAGGTNVGKSTLFNLLLGEEVSLVSPFARTTKSPAVYLHRAVAGTWLADGMLPGYRRAELRSLDDLSAEHADGRYLFYRLHDHAEISDLILMDSPDLDSNYPANHRVAEDLLLASDAVLFVTTPEKYNDEACVEFIERAGRLGKRLYLVLNKCDNREVLDDLVARVLPAVLPAVALAAAGEPSSPQLPAGAPEAGDADWRLVAYRGPEAAGAAAPPAAARVVAAPYLRATERMPAEWLERVRAALRPGPEAPAIRATAFRGALTQFAADFGALLEATRAEARAIGEFRAEIAGVAARRAADYRRTLSASEFWELDQVYKEVLAEFRVPLVDDFYAAVGRAGRGIARGFRAFFGRETDPPEVRREAERREADRTAALDGLQACFIEVAETADRAPGALRPAAQAAAPPLPSTARLGEISTTYSNVVRDFTARWIREETLRTIGKLKASPYLTSIIRVVKGVLQLGTGMLSAYLTGGIHPHDLLVGPMTERGMKYLLDVVGGGIYYQNLRREFLTQREELFAHMLHREIVQLVIGQIPEPLDPLRLAEIEKELSLFGRG